MGPEAALVVFPHPTLWPGPSRSRMGAQRGAVPHHSGKQGLCPCCLQTGTRPPGGQGVVISTETNSDVSCGSTLWILQKDPSVGGCGLCLILALLLMASSTGRDMPSSGDCAHPLCAEDSLGLGQPGPAVSVCLHLSCSTGIVRHKKFPWAHRPCTPEPSPW